MYTEPRSVSESESLSGFGVVELEPGNEVRGHTGVEFVSGKRIEHVDTEHI